MATPPRKSARAAAAAAPADPTEPMPAPADNIWLAGLGALASAQANARAEGSKAFEALVKQGIEMQTRTQALAKDQWSEAAQRMGAMTAQAGAVGSWDRLGGIFEGRVARALASMGMPSASEIAELKARVQALEQALAALRATPADPAPARPAGSTRRKSPPST